MKTAKTQRSNSPGEVDPHTYSSASNPALAALPLSAAQCRAAPVPILDVEASARAIAWNRRQHPRVFGVAPDDIRTDLARYVNLAVIRELIDAHNDQFPDAAIALGDTPIDAVFVEAIHQFQAKNFLERSQVDGLAGESTLATLGIMRRKGTSRFSRPNRGAVARLRKVDVAAATDGEFTARGWFRSLMNPGFLGVRFRNGVHPLLVHRLRAAERWLASLPQLEGATPVETAHLLGLHVTREEHKGARPTTTTSSMHSYGLALDVRYTANPYVREPQFSAVLKRAALLVSRFRITHRTAPAYFSSLGTNEALSTAEIHRILTRRNDDFRRYLGLQGRQRAIAELLRTIHVDGTRGVFAPGDETVEAAARRLDRVIRADLRSMRAPESPFRIAGGGLRDPRAGFLDLPVELVVALRDAGCLAWGAVDLGAMASGDMMHFDLRVSGLGARLATAGGNFRVVRGHPCIKRRKP